VATEQIKQLDQET